MTKKIVLLLCILVVFAGFVSAKAHKINRLGNPRTCFYRPMKSVADLQKMVAARKADIQRVLEMRGWKGNIDDLVNAVNSEKVIDTTIEPGAEIPFMAYHRRGKPGFTEDMVWAGKKPFAAFQVTFDSNGYTYYFYFPKQCGNFWMEERVAKTQPVMVPSVGVMAEDVCVTQPVHVKITTANAPEGSTIQFTVDGNTESMPASAMTEKDLPAYTQPGPHTITAAMQGASPATTTFNVKACPPVCAVTVTPAEIKRKKPFTVDASGSQMAQGVTGNLKSASVEISLAGTPTPVLTFDMPAPTLKKDDVKVKKAGSYTLKASVTDDLGQQSTNACEANFEVQKPKNPFFVGAFFGKERLFQNDDDFFGGRCAAEMGVKAGVLPEIAEELELELSFGGKINFRDGNNSSVFADVAINKIVGRGFFGGGATFWDLTEKDTRSIGLLLQGGFDVNEDGTVQFVGEWRAPFHKFEDTPGTNNDIENNYQFWGGIRIRPWR